MPDINMLKTFVIVVAFLGSLVAFLAIIPTGFMPEIEGRAVDVPPEWEGIDLAVYKDSWNYTLDAGGNEYFDIGGRNLRFYWVNHNYIQLIHRFGPLLYYNEGGEWFNREAVKVSYIAGVHEQIDKNTLDAEYASFGNMKFLVKFDSEAVFNLNVHFSFNQTAYTKPSDAWLGNELRVMIGIEWDQANTAMNAWDLIAMLLFFQLPQVHWVVNVLLAIPIWAAIGFISVMVILKILDVIIPL